MYTISIQWKQDPDWGYLVPVEIPGIDIDSYLPRTYYDDNNYNELVSKLREERRSWLNKNKGLKEEILLAIEPPYSTDRN